MANPKVIILPEHNSSRLIFTDITAELHITDTTDSQYCTETSSEQYSNNWQLGKLNSKIWLLEDVGIYDSNHEHTAKIWYTDPNTHEEVIIYNVRRIYEYSQECDRLYTEHSGGLKMMLVDNGSSYKANMYIKYERNLPGAFERIESRLEDGKTLYYVMFYKYNLSNEVKPIEIIGITYKLDVTTDELDNDGNPKQMEGLNYADITIDSADIDFSKLSIDFSITNNKLNDIRIGIVGTNSINKKFISPYISSNCLEPSYFIVQVPENRSWICYRTLREVFYGIKYTGRTLDGSDCCILNRKDGGLNGYFGTYNIINNLYEYTIEIPDKNNMFILELPKMFENYTLIEYKNQNDESIPYDGYNHFYVFNELDGLHYLIIQIPITSKISKIILKY